MFALAPAGEQQRNCSPIDQRCCVNRTLRLLWPLLLDASNAADGPDPAAAAPAMRKAAELLLAAASRLE